MITYKFIVVIHGNNVIIVQKTEKGGRQLMKNLTESNHSCCLSLASWTLLALAVSGPLYSIVPAPYQPPMSWLGTSRHAKQHDDQPKTILRSTTHKGEKKKESKEALQQSPWAGTPASSGTAA